MKITAVRIFRVEAEMEHAEPSWEERLGMRRNEQLARTLREAVGDDVDIMLDAWMSWDVPYAIAMAARLAELRPRWIEEPVMPDRVESCAAIRRASLVPIATG